MKKSHSLFTLAVLLVTSAIPAAAQTSLVATGAVWKYLDNGTDQGTAWRDRLFADGSWAQGPARLGYGGDGEVTVVSFGPEATNKFITTYFRHSFNVANPATITNLILRIQRDDGAIVYLNGTEVFRSNMPADPINYLTLATAAADETSFFGTNVSPALLVTGANVLAAEVHQVAVDSSDLGFDASLVANAPRIPPVVSITSPTNNASFTSPVSITVNATATDSDGTVALVEFFAGATKIGEDNATPFSVTWPNVAPGNYALTARATDNTGVMATSGPVQITVINGGTALVAPGSVWKYLDNGSDQGTQWQVLGFIDAAWAQGPAQLGYGDGDEATTVSFGTESTNKYITTYFRHTFNVANPASITALSVRLLRDDGAVVYLNNTEIFRSNMPTGPINYLTLAAANVGGAAESTFFENNVNPNVLVTGQNILAVEIHQDAITSSDISFDLVLAANAPPERPTVTLTAPANGATFVTPEPITLGATAADADGTISLVEFFSGNTKVGEDATTPYNFVWRAANAGMHVLTARATDNTGLMATSAPVSIDVVFGGTAIVASGQVWKYLDNGSDQGTQWRPLAFIDTAWAQGPAQLGYGDGDEATVVGFGPEDTNKFVTTYFRHTFNVANPATFTNVLVRVLRDDGAVVYLNNTEIFRSNMTNGPVDYLTFALAAVGGADEETFFQAPVNRNLLVTGQNILAAEIHQSSVTSSDLGFDLILVGNVPARFPTVQITSPTNGQTFSAVANVPINAAAADFDGAVTQVLFRVNGTTIGVDTQPPFTFTAQDLNVGSYTLLAVATDNLGNNTTSAPVTIQVVLGPLVATGATWKYLDDGSNQGTTWTGVGFIDTAWAEGPAELGYGDGDEATVVGFGPDANNKHITTYFRHHFTVASPSAYTNLLLRLLRDDGAVVYINGDEVFRSNMPAGVIDYLTAAAANVSGANETTFFTTDIDPSALLAGMNVIAVEIHQDVGTSSDISMNLELIGQKSQGPALTIRRVGNNVEINWTGSGFALQQANTVTGAWMTIMPLVTSGPYTITGPVTGMRYFRLISL